MQLAALTFCKSPVFHHFHLNKELLLVVSKIKLPSFVNWVYLVKVKVWRRHC